MNQIVQTFFQFQIKLKIYHWQTNSYSRHKATDTLLSSISDKIDTFVETLQGKTSTRVKFAPDTSIVLANVSNKEAVELLKKFAEYLSGDLGKKIAKHTDLLNMRDEMLAMLNQTLYLFSFNKA
jgi:DNA-binding ferritin-like protein